MVSNGIQISFFLSAKPANTYLLLFCVFRLWNLDGFHLHVWVVLLVIFFSEAVAVVQQEAMAQQLHSLTQLEIFGGIILIYMLLGDLHHTARENVLKESNVIIIFLCNDPLFEVFRYDIMFTLFFWHHESQV